MIPSLEGWPTRSKEAPSPHEIRLTPLDTSPVFQCLREYRFLGIQVHRGKSVIILPFPMYPPFLEILHLFVMDPFRAVYCLQHLGAEMVFQWFMHRGPKFEEGVVCGVVNIC